jgi:hypothetical protein
MESLKDWAIELTRETYGVAKDHPELSAGFDVFYSPIFDKPEVMIVGYQPGGNANDYARQRERFEKGDFAPPTVNAYASADFRLAQKVRALFDGRAEDLAASVAFNLIFFRSASAKTWSEVAAAVRAKLEAFCFAKDRDIIKNLQPRVVLALGFETYELLKTKVLHGLTEEKEHFFPAGSKQKLMVTAKVGGMKIIGIKHPTGGRISGAEIAEVRTMLEKLAKY